MAKHPNLRRHTEIFPNFSQTLRDCWLAGYSRSECHMSLNATIITNTLYWHRIVDKTFDDLESYVVVIRC